MYKTVKTTISDSCSIKLAALLQGVTKVVKMVKMCQNSGNSGVIGVTSARAGEAVPVNKSLFIDKLPKSAGIPLSLGD